MGKEIERKYLVADTSWRENQRGEIYRQGYLVGEKERSVRIRTVGKKGILTIKGPTKGIARLEFEYQIPYQDAVEMLETLCLKPIIEKIRYRISYQGMVWEVDEFKKENDGLIVAEIELVDEKQQPDLPPWIGKEVTGDSRYYNANLITAPYCDWARNRR